jgi:cytochrome c
MLVLLLGTTISFAEQAVPSQLEQKGRALAERMCAQCHAVGRRGESPHAGAPLFRELGRRVDLDTFVDRLREGLMSDHPDMPTFHFDGENARAFRLYLRSIQAP